MKKLMGAAFALALLVGMATACSEDEGVDENVQAYCDDVDSIVEKIEAGEDTSAEFATLLETATELEGASADEESIDQLTECQTKLTDAAADLGVPTDGTTETTLAE